MNFKKQIRTVLNESRAGKELYRGLNRMRIAVSKRIPDDVYARMKYRENTGRKLNLTHPTTFNEKIWWLKLNNRDPLLTTCSDKVAVRDYVADKGYADILISSPGSYSDPRQIPFDSFDRPVFLKTNNGSGANARFDPAKEFDRDAFNKRFTRDLQNNYYWQSREWNYRDIAPRILVEEEIEAEDLVDFRFLCFDGQVRLIFADVDTAGPSGEHFSGARRNIYEPDFTPIDVQVSRQHYPLERVPRPPDLERMVAIAETLGEPFPFCRVDLYNPKPGLILFGEITFYPGGGTQLAEPASFEQEWGTWIDLSSPKIVRG